MKPNVGSVDQIVRIVVGLVLIALVFVGPRTPWGWLGLFPLATGIFRFCPGYYPFKIDTRKRGGSSAG